MCLNLLSTPSTISFPIRRRSVRHGLVAHDIGQKDEPHISRGFDGRDELEGHIGETDGANDGTEDLIQDPLVEQDRADKDVENTTAHEGEEEGGVARDLGWDLEFCCS